LDVYLINSEIVRVENGEKADDDAGDGQEVEHGVEQLAPDPAAATARAVEQDC